MVQELDGGSPLAAEPTGPLVAGGPVVVAIGGGHGQSATLRAVRTYAGAVTAIVSVADDGGSSGMLRAQMPDLPAPGDIRRCLGALAGEGSVYARILEHRFGEGQFAGHALGNLVLAALAQETGSFSAAIDEVAERVGAVGRVLPATVGPVELEAIGGGGDAAQLPVHVVGQVAVTNTPGLRRVALQPASPPSPPEVAEAIGRADQVVLGPGSLFTSVLAAAVVPAVRSALAATRAQRVFVANLAPQVPETEGLTVADEVAVLADHGIEVDVVVADPCRPGPGEAPGPRWVVHPVSAPGCAAHEPELLGAVLAELCGRRAPDGPSGPGPTPAR